MSHLPFAAVSVSLMLWITSSPFGLRLVSDFRRISGFPVSPALTDVNKCCWIFVFKVKYSYNCKLWTGHTTDIKHWNTVNLFLSTGSWFQENLLGIRGKGEERTSDTGAMHGLWLRKWQNMIQWKSDQRLNKDSGYGVNHIKQNYRNVSVSVWIRGSRSFNNNVSNSVCGSSTHLQITRLCESADLISTLMLLFIIFRWDNVSLKWIKSSGSCKCSFYSFRSVGGSHFIRCQ